MAATLIITPDGESAHALRFAYRHMPDIAVTSIKSIMGHRGWRVIVLPIATTASAADAEEYDRIIREVVPTKMEPNGELIIL